MLEWPADGTDHVPFREVTHPPTERLLAAELVGYPTSGKGTVRFPHAQPISVALVTKIVKARLAERAMP